MCARVRVPTFSRQAYRPCICGRGVSLPDKVIAFKGEPAFPEPSIKMAYLDTRAQHLINPYFQDTMGEL